ncbi:PEP-CTERM sorting domain-containing protein [Pseudoduganella flava]|uniref:PEP-CTERM sorting domain-containing protein n=2 Tax=Pseudoduganella flava TaxID=871742 RepID=A0ABX6G6L7_9BURK|nr:PEP-CTERM sorting domain-containing protein [Pseudoduganella flava]
MTTSEGRAAVGFGQSRGATDLFGETVDYVAWDGPVYGIPDAPGGRVTTLSKEAYGFIAAPQGADATVPVSTGGALTSRSGGRMADDSASTGPTLTPAPVPEPSTWAMLVGGLGALALLRRRR